ncbi:MAG: DM13 domain-containing protein [Kiloniellales bacterium]|nr:DM13 domain-containing protein [Kiloniellales bacterium]
MGRIVVSLLVGCVLGGFVGFAVGIFVYPYIFLADIVAAERLDDPDARTVLATGAFIHADPNDPVHYGSGKVTLYEDAVFLDQDFEVGPGPKYHVYLVPVDDVTPDTDVEATAFVDLGRLRAFKGSQVFKIPESVDPGGYASVVIWCEQFGVLISPARLVFQQSG